MTETVEMTLAEYEAYPSRHRGPDMDVWYRFGTEYKTLIKYHEVPVDMRLCTLKFVKLVDTVDAT